MDVYPEILVDLISTMLWHPLSPSEVPHDDFKALTTQARAVVRTGEATPYANVALWSGVVF